MPNDMTDAKAKLCNLEPHMPGMPSHLYAFAKMLGDGIPSSAEPSAVVLAADLVVYDIQRGASGVPSALRDLPSMVIAAMMMYFDDFVGIAFTPEFAAEVLAFRAKADAAAQAARG